MGAPHVWKVSLALLTANSEATGVMELLASTVPAVQGHRSFLIGPRSLCFSLCCFQKVLVKFWGVREEKFVWNLSRLVPLLSDQSAEGAERDAASS